MERIKINSWSDLAGDIWSSLILGNGASIAIHKDFEYPTLHSIATTKGLLPTTASVFSHLGTTDFEHVLLACWYAERVNGALGTPSPDITAAYAEVRKALIEAVYSVHPAYADVAADLQRAGSFASIFPTVVSLNYDLTLYWAMLMFNATNGTWFKDAFHGEFQTQWEYLRRPYGYAKGTSLVFYAHGSLAVARDDHGNETKLNVGAGAADLLNAITQRWSSGRYMPVFVSEGSSQQKIAAIRRSRYLAHVYEDVLPALGSSLVIYGWSFDERDQHVLDAIAVNPPEKLAVSVFTQQSDSNQQAFCHKVLKLVRESLPNTDVTFFDSLSPGCWNNP